MARLEFIEDESNTKLVIIESESLGDLVFITSYGFNSVSCILTEDQERQLFELLCNRRNNTTTLGLAR